MFKYPIPIEAFAKEQKIPVEFISDMYEQYCENHQLQYEQYLEHIEEFINDEAVRDDFANSLSTPTKIGERLLQARQRVHLTQIEVASKLDISKQSMYNYEKGNTIPPTQLMDKFAKLYGVTSYELSTGLPFYENSFSLLNQEDSKRNDEINSRLELITKNTYIEYAKAIKKTIGKSPTERDWLIETSTQFLNDLTIEQLYEIRKSIILSSILNIE